MFDAFKDRTGPEGGRTGQQGISPADSCRRYSRTPGGNRRDRGFVGSRIQIKTGFIRGGVEEGLEHFVLFLKRETGKRRDETFYSGKLDGSIGGKKGYSCTTWPEDDGPSEMG
jgi:hypothetical protein